MDIKSKIFLIAGPCVIENESHSLMMAEKIANICQRQNISFVFKSSFDKANRSSINSKRGVNLDDALKIFEKIKNDFNLPILTSSKYHFPLGTGFLISNFYFIYFL